MNFILVSNYFYPEMGAAPNRITSLAEELAERNHGVEVICPLPNYPEGKIFAGYGRRFLKKEKRNSITINRYWIYPSVSKNPFWRIISMFSFSVSLWAYLFNYKKIKKADWVIIQSPPLPVSFSATILFKKIFKKKVALNVSDLWPLSALELGAISKGRLYRLLERMEQFNYKNADKIIGQSDEILEHIEQLVSKKGFLYRNIQKQGTSTIMSYHSRSQDKTFKIIYAGLLGIAQGVFEIVEKIDFKGLDVEFHIYGNGNERDKIVEYIDKNPHCNISYKGAVSKSELHGILPNYQAALVPLVNNIKGAVPSKIFELMQLQVPILFCGGGEGAKIVEKYNVGFTSSPRDYPALSTAMLKIKNLSEEDYFELKNNCRTVSNNVFNFEKQVSDLINSLQ